MFILSKNKKISPRWYNIKKAMSTFGQEIDIPGLKDACVANHVLVRITWVIFLTIGFVLTTYFIYGNVRDYYEEPTATKVYPAKSANYTMPPVYFGMVQTKQHVDGWRSMNLSVEAIEYIRSLDWQYDSGENESVYEKGKGDFFDFVKSNNVSRWSSVFSDTGLQAVRDLRLMCSSCLAENYGASRFVPFLPYSVSILYEIPFKPASPSWVRKSDQDIGAWFSFLKNYSENYYLALGKTYNLIIPVDLFHIWPNFDYDVRVNVHRIKAVNNGECIDNEPIANGNLQNPYHPKLCADNCSDIALQKCAQCRKVRRDRIASANESVEKLDYCSTLIHNPKCQFNYKVSQSISQCNQNCLPLCDQLIYEYGIVNVPSFDDRIQITFYPTYTDVGVMTYEEVPTYTLESAISNIGGQLGLWLGLSIVSLVQIVLFWIDHCLTKQNDNVNTTIDYPSVVLSKC